VLLVTAESSCAFLISQVSLNPIKSTVKINHACLKNGMQSKEMVYYQMKAYLINTYIELVDMKNFIIYIKNTMSMLISILIIAKERISEMETRAKTLQCRSVGSGIVC
jgi:hypothetical protein